MTDRWTDRLSEYLDGDLAAEDRTALETHLERCPECRETLASLRGVVTRARALADRPPGRDLWPGIAARIGAQGGRPAARPAARRGFTFSLPQLAAAGIALAVASGGTAWLLHPGTAVPPIPPAVPGPPAITAAAGEARGTGSYDVAVADLERILEEGRGRLDTATVRVLERNLAAIDAALTQARRAVEADSANLYLNSHLAATMRRKLELLRQAATLVATAS